MKQEQNSEWIHLYKFLRADILVMNENDTQVNLLHCVQDFRIFNMIPRCVMQTNRIDLVTLGEPEWVRRNASGAVTAYWSNRRDTYHNYELQFSSNGEWSFGGNGWLPGTCSNYAYGRKTGKVFPLTDRGWYVSLNSDLYASCKGELDQSAKLWRDLIDKEPALEAVLQRSSERAAELTSEATLALWRKISWDQGNEVLRDIARIRLRLQECIEQLDIIQDAAESRLGAGANPEAALADRGQKI
jgi:hypothetical protein